MKRIDSAATHERPIILSAPMVLALSSGRKTQHRERLRHQPLKSNRHPDGWLVSGGRNWWHSNHHRRDTFKNGEGREALIDSEDYYVPLEEWLVKFISPFKVGQRLWVRETFFVDGDGMHYDADGEDIEPGPGHHWEGRVGRHSAATLPRWAARFTVEVTDVRVHRVQDISEDDALAVGCVRREITQEWVDECAPGTPERELAQRLLGGTLTAKNDFIDLWRRTNGFHAWGNNPFVWAITFRHSEREVRR